jgi:HAD superfamily hydrolase (TIGR01459 family)
MSEYFNPVDNEYIEVWQGIEEHLGRFDLIICDLWGVMHDGVNLHREAEKAISCARHAGVRTVFLSNAPRPREFVRQHLIEMGLDKGLTDFVVTSGGLARDEVRDHFSGANLYHMGPESDHNTIEGLPVSFVDHPDKADVIFATGLDFSMPEQHRDWLMMAAGRNTPLLCANPDRIVHVGDKLFYCAGIIADLYEEMQGPVKWYGKPMPYAFNACLKEVGKAEVSADRVLMIGDSMQTDIAGAVGVGFKSLLVTSGIHRQDLMQFTDGGCEKLSSEKFHQALNIKPNRQGYVPTALIRDLKV